MTDSVVSTRHVLSRYWNEALDATDGCNCVFAPLEARFLCQDISVLKNGRREVIAEYVRAMEASLGSTVVTAQDHYHGAIDDFNQRFCAQREEFKDAVRRLDKLNPYASVVSIFRDNQCSPFNHEYAAEKMFLKDCNYGGVKNLEEFVFYPEFLEGAEHEFPRFLAARATVKICFVNRGRKFGKMFGVEFCIQSTPQKEQRSS